MARVDIVQEGAFDSTVREQINDMFTELYAGLASSGTAAITRTTAGVTTLLASSTANRTVVISVQITTTFADGDGAQPTLTIGQTGSATKFAAAAAFTGATAGTTFSFSGTLTANTALILTSVAATGTTSTGAATVTVIASPQ
jgi:hypothetical protein